MQPIYCGSPACATPRKPLKPGTGTYHVNKDKPPRERRCFKCWSQANPSKALEWYAKQQLVLPARVAPKAPARPQPRLKLVDKAYRVPPEPRRHCATCKKRLSKDEVFRSEKWLEANTFVCQDHMESHLVQREVNDAVGAVLAAIDKEHVLPVCRTCGANVFLNVELLCQKHLPDGQLECLKHLKQRPEYIEGTTKLCLTRSLFR
jgi:hypothetical protein